VVNACLKGLHLALFSPSTSEDCGTFDHALCWGSYFHLFQTSGSTKPEPALKRNKMSQTKNN